MTSKFTKEQKTELEALTQVIEGADHVPEQIKARIAQIQQEANEAQPGYCPTTYPFSS